MKNKAANASLVVVAVLLLSAVGPGVGSPAYAASANAPVPAVTITDLGTLGGDTSIATAINSLGQVVGSSYVAGNARQDAFLYSNGKLTDLGSLGGQGGSLAYGINDAGQVAGVATTPSASHAFLYSNSKMTDLGTLGGNSSQGNAINKSGQVAGFADTIAAARHAFLYSSGAMRDLGTLGGAENISYSQGINDSGQLTGNASIGGAQHAFLYANGAMHDLGTLGGVSSAGSAINNAGEVTGSAATASAVHAFLYSNGKMQDIAPFGATFSVGLGLDSAGRVVGLYDAANGGGQHAFLYISTSGSIDLNSLLPPGTGWTLNQATAINDSGDIVGNGTVNGKTHAFLLSGATKAPGPQNFAFQYDQMGNLTGIVAIQAPPPQTPDPQFSPANGPVQCGSTVTITDPDAAASIFYTTDGSAPSGLSTKYSQPIPVTKSEIIEAIAVDARGNEGPSSVVNVAFACTPAPPPAAPAFSPAPTVLGTCTGHPPPLPPTCTISKPIYDCPLGVTITDATSGTGIYYTLDGSPPSSGSGPAPSAIKYTGPVLVTQWTSQIRAIAQASGGPVGPETDAWYVCKAPPPNKSYSWIDITIATGGDDARHNSEVDGELWPSGSTAPSQTIILKPSDSPDQNGNVSWDNWTTSDQRFSLAAASPLSALEAINIVLKQHYSFPDTADNWNIQGVAITVFNKNGDKVVDPACVLDIGDLSNVPSGGSTYVARLTESQPAKLFPYSAGPTYGFCGQTMEGALLAVDLTVLPSGNPGKFNLEIDGVVRAANAGNGGGINPQNLSPSAHRVSETAGAGTNLNDYDVTFGGDCDANGIVTLGLEDFKTCTITNLVDCTKTGCSGGQMCCNCVTTPVCTTNAICQKICNHSFRPVKISPD